MRNAPAVSVASSDGWPWRLLQALLAFAAAAGLGAWVALHAGAAAGGAGFTAAALGAGAAGATWRLAAGERVDLNWDGAEWRVAGRPSTLTMACDLDRWLLVKATNERTTWFVVAAVDAGPAFQAWRTALFAERSN